MLKTEDELILSYGIVHNDEEEKERDSWVRGYLQAQKDIFAEIHDAAEFEARVAAELAKDLAKNLFYISPISISAEAVLRINRLLVEEEMDANCK